jgi:outer membrane protein OmpA-like peptidoglycan-associated protein
MGVAPGSKRGESTADALGELRSLLFGVESRRLDGLEQELRALAVSRLASDDLKSATAKVLAQALREAEVANHRDLADALAPLIVRAIQSEIRNSRDEMVEALYPLVGRLVAAAVADGLRRVTEGIAQQIDSLISARRWTWRMKSLATGRPVAEIALAESQRARLSRVLCLERGSGALIAVWPQAETDGRSDLMSGLIAAITEFAATTFAKEGGSLRALDLGARHVLLRSSATVIVAAECDGVVSPQDESAIDEAFLRLLGKHERMRQTTPADLAELETALDAAAPAKKPGGAARWIVRFVAAGLAAALLWSAGVALLHALRERRVEHAFAAARAGSPAAAFPLRLSFDHAAGRVTVAGLAPSASEAERLRAALQAPAEPYAVAADVEIVASAEALARAGAALDAERAATQAALQAQRGESERALVAATAERDSLRRDLAAARDAQSAADGATALRLERAEAALAQAQEQIDALRAGVEGPTARLARLLQSAAVFFMPGSSAFIDSSAAERTADELARLMTQTAARIRVVGHTDDSGSEEANRRIARARAEAMVGLLTKRGVPADHLVVVSKRAATPIADHASAAANRRVTFESLLESEPAN